MRSGHVLIFNGNQRETLWIITQERIGARSSNLEAVFITWPAKHDNCSRSKRQRSRSQGHVTCQQRERYNSTIDGHVNFKHNIQYVIEKKRLHAIHSRLGLSVDICCPRPGCMRQTVDMDRRTGLTDGHQTNTQRYIRKEIYLSKQGKLN